MGAAVRTEPAGKTDRYKKAPLAGGEIGLLELRRSAGWVFVALDA